MTGAGPLVKVCCITSEAEAALAIAAGASAGGLVGAMPSGPGIISDQRIAAIAAVVPRPVDTFLLTSRTDPDAIAAHHRDCGTTTIQLVDAVAEGDHHRLRALRPGVRLVQVIHVTGPEALAEALRVAAAVDAILLDSGRPGATVKELGGTGRTHDWGISRAIRERVGCPVYLAGGLNAGNVAAAIAAVGPDGIDVCSGVRTDGRLDPIKLAAFFEAVGTGGRAAADHPATRRTPTQRG